MRFALLFTLALGCTNPQPFDAGMPRDLGDAGIAYDPCTTWCLRPGDCMFAYPSDESCPLGYRCASRFSCSPDGGP